MTGLNFSPLERRLGLLSRVRSLGASPVQVVGATIGGLTLFGPLIGILVAVLRPGTDRGFVGAMALFAARGAWALWGLMSAQGHSPNRTSYATATLAS